MLHGFRRDECSLNNWIRPNGLGPNGLPLTNAATLLMENITFTPGTCGYLCPTSLSKMNSDTGRKWTPKFAEYKVSRKILLLKSIYLLKFFYMYLRLLYSV